MTRLNDDCCDNCIAGYPRKILCVKCKMHENDRLRAYCDDGRAVRTDPFKDRIAGTRRGYKLNRELVLLLIR